MRFNAEPESISAVNSNESFSVVISTMVVRDLALVMEM